MESARLQIDKASPLIGGKVGKAITVNGSMPGPLIRLREGQDADLRVSNRLREDTSIHWHGLILPYRQDGVPNISFPGINRGETFTYTFVVDQVGTYWYHPHFEWVGQDVGRYYATEFKSSSDAATSMAGELATVVGDIAAFHSVFEGTSVPEWLADFVLQSTSHIRNSMWLGDGRWFQYEAFDCVNVDSIHNDGERSSIYLTMFPEYVV